ncbi:MAG TPA: hypothetical protein DIW43_02610 [Spongiibacteraceae bacterium]|nr:hypothetical protein [Spongiibacteraceae bacterium]
MARPGRFDLLHHMLRSRNGVAVDTLSEFLSISKNAARQHVISLERSGYIAPSSLKATGRRPQQLYSITNAGVDLIPKRYSSMAGMLIETIAEQDSRNFSKIMKNMGKKVGQSASSARAMDTIELVEVMDSLGYEAELGSKKMKLSPTTACTII